ncbi:MAG: hypothetical protein ACREA9_10800 [Pyrinomonadaceae bacterium]
MHTARIWAAVCLLSLASCGVRSNDTPSSSYAAKYGLNESLLYSYEAERAIAYANVVLGKDLPLRFVATWRTSELTPRFEFSDVSRSSSVDVQCNNEKNICTFFGARPVPVYLVDDDKLGELENIFIPDGAKCVFVNVRSIRRLWDSFGMKRYEYSDSEPSRIHSVSLAVMLLHEMGHLVYGDSGSYSAPASFSADELDQPSQTIQNKEIRADKFATEQIINGRSAGAKPVAEAVLAVSNDVIVGDMLRSVKSAVSSYEVDKDAWGIFDGKVKSVLLSNNSYSHPNLFIRFQVMDYQLDPTPERYERLKSIGVAR